MLQKSCDFYTTYRQLLVSKGIYADGVIKSSGMVLESSLSMVILIGPKYAKNQGSGGSGIKSMVNTKLVCCKIVDDPVWLRVFQKTLVEDRDRHS